MMKEISAQLMANNVNTKDWLKAIEGMKVLAYIEHDDITIEYGQEDFVINAGQDLNRISESSTESL